jgi:hypothetical protein
VVTTTPRPIPVLKAIVVDPTTRITRGRTLDNAANLAPGVVLRGTLGYILLQEGDRSERPTKIQDALGYLAADAKESREGGPLFLYAVALDAAEGEGVCPLTPQTPHRCTSEANAKLDEALFDRQYEPSHELYVLKSYITGDFKQWVINKTGRPTYRRLPTRCSNGGEK